MLDEQSASAIKRFYYYHSPLLPTHTRREREREKRLGDCYTGYVGWCCFVFGSSPRAEIFNIFRILHESYGSRNISYMKHNPLRVSVFCDIIVLYGVLLVFPFMLKGDYMTCTHLQTVHCHKHVISYCDVCDTAYCKECGKEWKSWSSGYRWIYPTYPSTISTYSVTTECHK